MEASLSPVTAQTQSNAKIWVSAWISVAVIAFCVYHLKMSHGTKFEALILLIFMFASSLVVMAAPLAARNYTGEPDQWVQGKIAFFIAGLTYAIEGGLGLASLVNSAEYSNAFRIYDTHFLWVMAMITFLFVVWQFLKGRTEG